MLAMAFSRVRGLFVAGTFADGRVGLDFCLKEKPGLVVVDLYLPGMHGLEIVKEVRAKLPKTLILVITGHPDGELPARLIAQGVHGFVDKSGPLSYAIQAVEAVMNGGMFFAAHIPPTATTGGAVPERRRSPPASVSACARSKSTVPTSWTRSACARSRASSAGACRPGS